MGDVYVLTDGSRTAPLERVHCVSESEELQAVLEHNLDLLPKAQLGMKDSGAWLQIKREMPVPSPENGENTWSLDFLLADDQAIPTLVECKRFENTQSRREIVGQLFEYAANGRSYWTKEELIDHARQTAKSEEALRVRIEAFCGLSIEAYFEKLTANLKSSTMRLIFFLENTSKELRSVVEFLSEQMTGVEIFLVEARHYKREDLRLVVPWVFGYTEETRAARQKERAAAKSISAFGIGEEGFWASLEASALDREQSDAIRRFLAVARSTPGCEVHWGRGPRFVFPNLGSDRYLFALRRGGTLEWNFSNLRDIGDGFGTGQLVLEKINAALGTSYAMSSTLKYPQLAMLFWIPKTARLEELVRRLSEVFPQGTEQDV